jgi:hypothetical protein
MSALTPASVTSAPLVIYRIGQRLARWRGVLFSEQALLRVRREFFRPTDPANGYCEIAGGLNLMRYSEFLKYVRDTGWEFADLAVNTFLKPVPPLRFLSDMVMRVPVLRDYCVHNVYAVLRRAA